MKKEEKTRLYKEIGEYLIDISKLVFGGIILAGIMNIENLDKTLLFLFGGTVVAITGITGLILKTFNNNKD